MKFLSHIITDDSVLLDSDKFLSSKVDIKIIDSNSVVLGYVCSAETFPIFLDTLDHTLTKIEFGGYIKHIKSSATGLYVIHDGVKVYVNNLWKPIANLNNDTNMIHPYIKNDIKCITSISSNTTIKVFGGNFDPNISVDISGVDISNIDVISNNELDIDIITPPTVLAETAVVITRFGVPSFGGNVTISVVDNVTGGGIAGELMTDFENGGSGDALWGQNWLLEVFGGIDSVDGFFKSSKNSTPSSSTGPKNNGVFNTGSTYCFTERSGSNYGYGKYATATTDDFAELTSIEFSHHRYGTNMADLTIESLGLDGVWYNRYVLTGETHTSDTDVSLNVLIDTTSWDATAIRFTFGETTGYASDMGINDIKLTSA